MAEISKDLRSYVSDLGGQGYNVKAYGAVGNGSTDDTSAIQDTLDAANTAGGGIVVFPQGSYRLTDQLGVGSNTVVRGEPGATLAPEEGSYSNGNGTLRASSKTNVVIRDLHIDLSSITTTELRGILIATCDQVQVLNNTITTPAVAACYPIAFVGACTRFLISGNDLTTGQAAGILVRSGSNGSVIEDFAITENVVDGGAYGISLDINEIRFGTISNNLIFDQADGVGSQGHGVSLAGDGTGSDYSDSSARHVVISSNVIHDTQREGVHIEGFPAATIVSANAVHGAGTDGIKVIHSNNGTDSILIDGNLVTGATDDGIVVEGTMTATATTVSNNIVREAGDDGIAVLGTGTLETIISGNLVTDCTGNGIETNSDNVVILGNVSRTNANGLELFSSVSEALIAFNDFTGNTSAAVVNAGTSKQFNHNRGWDTEQNGKATITNGTTSIAVNHNLDITPAIQDISVTPIEDWGAASKFWITNPTSTQFTINVDADPTQDVDFAWTASIQ